MGMLSALIQAEVNRRYASIATARNLRQADPNAVLIEPGDDPQLLNNEPTQLSQLNQDELQALAEGIESAIEKWLVAAVTAPPPSGKVVLVPTVVYDPP